MQRQLGWRCGIALLLVGCGSSPPTTAPDKSVDVAVPPSLMSRAVPATEATASVEIAFQSPRTSFSSDKIDLQTGKTLPSDDGMGPEGDISFFYDGSAFQVIANAGGGANRALSNSEGDGSAREFAMAPVKLQPGSEVLVKAAERVYRLRITDLRAGSMRFLPDGTGTGTGSLAFTYRILER